MGRYSLECYCTYHRAGGVHGSSSVAEVCPAVDIALSLSHLCVVAPHVMCVRELSLTIIQRREIKIIEPRWLTL